MAKIKKSNKDQGKQANPESLASTNQIPDPKMLSRGIGSSFAMAVANLMDKADSLAGSKNGFLGIEKAILDPKENTHSSILPKQFDGKKKLNEK